MIVTEIKNNIVDDPDFVGGRDIYTMTFEDLDLDKRIQRLEIAGGVELGLKLKHGHPILREGDVLVANEDRVFVVKIAPTDVLVITPQDIHQMGFVAHSLGNRHLPAQFTKPGELTGELAGEAAMIVQYDHTVVAFLEEHGIEYQRTELVPPVPFRHAGHTH